MIPEGVSFEQAAALPLVALTVLQVRAPELRSFQTSGVRPCSSSAGLVEQGGAHAACYHHVERAWQR